MTSRQQLAITGLLACGTRDEAAARARVSPRTLYRWLQDPEFIAELGRQRSRVIDGALNVLAAGIEDAATTLREVSRSKKAAPAARVQAARAILDTSVAFDERSGMLTRLEEVEAAIKVGKVPDAT